MNLLEVKRLLRDGVRPGWLVLEVMPPQLGDSRQRILCAKATARELPFVCRYTEPWRAAALFARSRLVPCYKHRRFLTRRLAPGWLPADDLLEEEEVALLPLGGDDGWQVKTEMSAEDLRRRMEASRNSYRPPLSHFELAAISDRAMHEILGLCRREGVRVALLLTPEGQEFQSWYPPEARRQIEGYCGRLGRDYDVPVIDARCWLPDDAFADSHHVLRRGAEAFTRRLGPDALQPFVDGRLGAWTGSPGGPPPAAGGDLAAVEDGQ
jgi:hypothetical protein